MQPPGFTNKVLGSTVESFEKVVLALEVVALLKKQQQRNKENNNETVSPDLHDPDTSKVQKNAIY